MGWTFYNATGQRLQTSATVLATQAEMETGTALTSFVTPGRTQNHPGVLKGWASVASDGTLYEGYNVTSSGRDGTGDYNVVWATDFSNTTYSFVGMTSTSGISDIHRNNHTAGQLDVKTYASGSLTDSDFCVQVAGDQ